MTRGRCAILVFSAAIVLSACSGTEEKRQVYRQSESTAPLKVPPHLNQPQGRQALMVPDVNKEALGDQPFDARPPAKLSSDDEFILPEVRQDEPIQRPSPRGHKH